jgi:GTP-binding protein
MQEYKRKVLYELNFVDFVPVLFISALTGKRVDQVLPLAMEVQEERLVRLTTAQLNKILHQAQDRHQSPTTAGKPFRIYYGTQVRSEPPTFLLYVNNPELAHFTYIRFLENQIRLVYPFIGTPIRIVLKKRERDERK